MNNLDKQYLELLQDILDNGVEKTDRTGTGTISVFGRQIRHKMSEGFPLLTSKKMAWNQIVSELLWFLRGETNIQSLVKEGNYIWVGDAYKFYQKNNPIKYKDTAWTREEFIEKIKTDDEFAEEWGEMGPIYGKQWRDWGGRKTEFVYEFNETREHWDIPGVDQIQILIDTLKINPDSRRMMVSAWNMADLSKMKLPPCHYGFQVYTRELSLDERLDLMRKRTRDGTVDYDNRHHRFLDYHNIPKRAISLMWNQRSVDTPLGLPFNIASYGLLLSILAKEVNMMPDELIGNLGDTHIYKDQIEGVKEQINRTWYNLPKLLCKDEFHYLMDKSLVGNMSFSDKINKFKTDFFKLEGYQSHDKINFPLSN